VLGALLLILLSTTIFVVINRKIQHEAWLSETQASLQIQSEQAQNRISTLHLSAKQVAKKLRLSLADTFSSLESQTNGDFQIRENLLLARNALPSLERIEVFSHQLSSKTKDFEFKQGIVWKSKDRVPNFYQHEPINHPPHYVSGTRGIPPVSLESFDVVQVSRRQIPEFVVRYSIPVVDNKNKQVLAMLYLQLREKLLASQTEASDSELFVTTDSGRYLGQNKNTATLKSSKSRYVFHDYPDIEFWFSGQARDSTLSSVISRGHAETLVATTVKFNLEQQQFKGRLFAIVPPFKPTTGSHYVLSKNSFYLVFGLVVVMGLLFIWLVRVSLSPLEYLIATMMKPESESSGLDFYQFNSSIELSNLSRILHLVRNRLNIEEKSINDLNQKVASTELKSKNLIETIPSSIIVADQNGEIVIANKHTAALFGYEISEISGKSLLMFIPERFREGHTQLVKGYFNRPENKIMGKGRVLFGLRKDGSEFPVEIGLASLELEGELLVIANVVDMTLRMHYEDQILRAKEEAVLANELKSEFVANVSHEIRTPMNALVNLSKLALKTDTDDRTRDYLLKIHSASRSLLSIVNEILDYSKIEAGKMEIEHTTFKLQDVLQNVFMLFSGNNNDKPVELTVNSQPGLPEVVVGDPLRISQVIGNLVTNAMKFTEKGEIKITVDLLTQQQNTGIFRFTVSDTGIGMSQEQQERLFTAFSQADSSISRRFGGTGLGLKICKQLVELMGGQISVTSVEGEGSQFSFTLNLEIKDAALVDSSEIESILPLSSETNFQIDSMKQSVSGMHVLVAEDNDINQQVVCEILQDAGVSVDLVFNGAEAIETLERQRERYDAVLMDVQMPVMDGITAVQKIRSMPWGKMIPVIAMTARASRSDQLDCLQAGMNEHIAKPIEDNELFRALSKWRQSSEKIQAMNARMMSVAASENDSSLLQKNKSSLIPDKVEFLNLAKVRKKTQISDSAMLRILRRFLDNNQEFIPTLVGLLNSKNWDVAKLHVHNVRGTAGYIGAEMLVEQAAIVENALENVSKTGWTPDIRRLQQAHEMVVSTLEKLLNELEKNQNDNGDSQSSFEPLHAEESHQALQDIMQEVSSYLRNNNLSVRKELIKLKKALGNSYQNYYKELEQQVEMLNFIEAQKTITRLSNAITSKKDRAS